MAAFSLAGRSASAEGFGSCFGVGKVEKERKGPGGRARKGEAPPGRGMFSLVIWGKASITLLLCLGKKLRERWLGKVLLLEIVMAFECIIAYLSLDFFASLTMST